MVRLTRRRDFSLRRFLPNLHPVPCGGVLFSKRCSGPRDAVAGIATVIFDPGCSRVSNVPEVTEQSEGITYPIHSGGNGLARNREGNDMTNPNNGNRELAIDELNNVSGGGGRSDLGQQLQLALQEANNIYTRAGKAQSDISAKYSQFHDGIAQNFK